MRTIQYKIVITALLLAALFFVGCSHTKPAGVQHLTALEAKQLIDRNAGKTDFVVLDIRTPKEFKAGHIPGAIMLDYYSPGFKKGLQQLDRSKRYLIYCRTGNRTSRTLKIIDQMGFNVIYHMKDGIVDWDRQKLPIVKS